MVTLVGVIFILPALYFFVRLQTTNLFYLFVAASPFIASTIVLKKGSDFGMQPAFFISVLFIFSTLLELTKRKYLVSKRLLFSLKILITFGVWAIISISFPFIHLLIGNTSVELHSAIFKGFAHEFQIQRVSQTFYLLLFVITVIMIALKVDSIQKVKIILKILILGGLFSCLWAIGAQLIYANILGFQYPEWLFNNNPGFGQGYDQRLWFNGKFLVRLCSVAYEPSVFGFYLTTLLSLIAPLNYYKIYLFKPKFQRSIEIIFLIVMILSTSSTAIAGVTFILISYIFLTFVNLLKKPFKLNKNFFYVMSLVSIFLVSFVIVVTVIINYIGISLDGIIDIFYRVSIAKKDTGSFVERSSGFWIGLRNFIETFFLGCGWGSNRLFDINSTILANLGIIGYLLFISMLTISFRNASIYNKLFSKDISTVFVSFGFSLVSSFFLMSLSVPDLNYTYFWVVFGVLFAIPNIVRNEINSKYNTSQHHLVIKP